MVKMMVKFVENPKVGSVEVYPRSAGGVLVSDDAGLVINKLSVFCRLLARKGNRT